MNNEIVTTTQEPNLTIDQCVDVIQKFLDDMQDTGYYNETPIIHVKTVNRINRYDRVTRSVIPDPLTYFKLHVEIRNNGGFTIRSTGKTLEDAFNRAAERTVPLRQREAYRKALRAAELSRQNLRAAANSADRAISAKEIAQLNVHRVLEMHPY